MTKYCNGFCLLCFFFGGRGEFLNGTHPHVLQKLQRDVNCLSDSNRATRKRALERLHKESVGHSPSYPPTLLQGLMEFMLKPLLKMISDPVEKCRELAINLIAE